jgi:3-hydroxyisobutyrate dehydrogenase-like beta-hydroxyacid dehydrogenase
LKQPGFLFAGCREADIARRGVTDCRDTHDVAYERQSFLDLEHSEVGFSVSLLHKDVALGLAWAGEHHPDLPQAQTLGKVLDRALDSGLGEHDVAAVLTLLRCNV